MLSDLLYYPLYYLIRYRRKIVRKNLVESFPEKNLKEIISIEKKFYHFFMDMTLESCKLASLTQDEIRSRVHFVNINVVNDALNQGKSVSALAGHYGNWEWMSSVGLWLNEDAVCAQVYHKLVNPSFDRIMRELRERMGNVCVDMKKTARFVANMSAEKKSCMLALIADQSPKRRDIKHYVQFLNHTVPVLVGPEKLTKHYGNVPVYANIQRVKRGYYECDFTVLHEDASSLPDYELSDLYFKRLEEEIKKRPEYYLWTHNRFKYAQETDQSN